MPALTRSWRALLCVALLLMGAACGKDRPAAPSVIDGNATLISAGISLAGSGMTALSPELLFHVKESSYATGIRLTAAVASMPGIPALSASLDEPVPPGTSYEGRVKFDTVLASLPKGAAVTIHFVDDHGKAGAVSGSAYVSYLVLSAATLP